MSDLDLTKSTNFTGNQSTRSTQDLQDLKDQVVDAGSEMKQRAGEALQTSAEIAGDKFREAADATKDAAAATADHLQDKAREQQRSGADFVDRFAGNIREAAHAFDNDAPFAAHGINSAADYVEDAAEKIRNGSFRDLVDSATDFAKRQPVAFLGLSVLAGFTAVRFLKASGRPSQARNRQAEDIWSNTSSKFDSQRDSSRASNG
ncbi:hypothetical protein [Bradyrhizobium sp.]|uniref:hypothetical protein n=1 Tax=Bradyrhizobium sp. TaxID=376 RepID=UPI0026354330|nr:hypothetical protein [Bradyrhizobium sp.]